MKNIILLIALLTISPAIAQKSYKAKILLTSGETKEGYASLPSNGLLDGGAITLKPEKKGKGTKITKDEISSAIYTSDEGKEYFFESTQVQHLMGKQEMRLAKKKYWIVATYSNPHITLYNFGESYSIDKDGTMIIKSATSNTWAEIFVCLKRQNEEIPTSVTSYTYGATVLGHEGRFRKACIKYFGSDNKFSERIENKEWEHTQVKELAEEYAKYKDAQ